MKRKSTVEPGQELFQETAVIHDENYEYEDDIIDKDFIEDEKEEQDDFDYDDHRMHLYDNYKGRITNEIAVIKYEALVRHYALKYCGDGAEYEDLVQEGMTRIIKRLEKCKDGKLLTAYFKKDIPGFINRLAERLRTESNRDNCVSLCKITEPVTEAVGYDWHERETEMFRQLKKLLTENEMQILGMIYRGYSVRMTARIRKVSHTAIEKTISRIRQKLTPLKPWLEDKTEFPCVTYDYS